MVHDPYWDLVPEPRYPEFDPKKTAMIHIDLQYLDAHPDGWMGRLCRARGMPDHLNERFEFIQEILPNVRRLQDACRKAGVEVMHVRIAHRTRNIRDSRRDLLTAADEVEVLPFDDDFLPEVAPVGDEIIFNKTSVSTFNSTSIDQTLRFMGIDRLLVCGIVTEGCVELTARDAADKGYYVTLVEDGCASSTHAAHYDAVQRMSDGGVIAVRKVDELIAMMQPVPA